ncbi:uncharacterized protein BO88DRAFT_71966 [Aspergillus vadensis CBS 113365]|uniref:Uncharacterized protein n=1 Tax=Aspergillus vadensis (strain CBS 113365 / IMI 142717 / IBT 24658) TaxID=1448311 RepID=A0A319CHY8_ASPVC|nr:hypothetical protein BO88DRAFT_71966 [Aspergillus vadensis CBS 113365]PYH67842.1 hypothetical protein BO88DRAFT_71966 [Aspergillus vadensis CBS 113365]
MVPSDRLARADPPVSDLSVRILPLAMNQSSSRQNFRLHLLTKSPRILSLFSAGRTTRHFFSFFAPSSLLSGVVDSRLATILLLLTAFPLLLCPSLQSASLLHHRWVWP